MFDRNYIEDFLFWDKGSSLFALWIASRDYPIFEGNLDLAKNGFFFLLERFMRDGMLKLARDSVFWEGSIEDQLKRFEEAWPEEYDDTVEEKDINGLWWYVFAPAGAVWVYSDGKLVWT